MSSYITGTAFTEAGFEEVSNGEPGVSVGIADIYHDERGTGAPADSVAEAVGVRCCLVRAYHFLWGIRVIFYRDFNMG